jgi:peptidoglycan/LPS O-acetylase OafA/YrhL
MFAVMSLFMTIIAAYSYGTALLLYTGVKHLAQTGSSFFTPVQGFVEGGNLALIILFTLQGIHMGEKRDYRGWQVWLAFLLATAFIALFIVIICISGK